MDYKQTINNFDHRTYDQKRRRKIRYYNNNYCGCEYNLIINGKYAIKKTRICI